MSDRVIASVPSAVSDLISLTKPKLSSLVMFTMAGGIWLAPLRLPPLQILLALVSTAGVVGAACALNCYFERDVDRLMSRTCNRPLPAGRMEPPVALWFGLTLAVTCLPALALTTNPLTGLLGLLALVSYVWGYTPLKRRSWTAVLVGSFPGALPPLMGWTAATGKIDAPGVTLFAILCLWQIPHFLAIALFRKKEYAAAGLTSLPLAHGDLVARRHAVVYTAALAPVTLLPFFQGIAGPFYLAAASLLSAAFLGYAVWGWALRLGPGWARKFFFVSLIHLTGLFVAFFLDGRPLGS